MPWWAMTLLAFSVAFCGAIVLATACCCGGRNKKPRKKRSKKSAQPEPEETEMYPQIAEPVPESLQMVPIQTSQMPLSIATMVPPQQVNPNYTLPSIMPQPGYYIVPTAPAYQPAPY